MSGVDKVILLGNLGRAHAAAQDDRETRMARKPQPATFDHEIPF